MLLSQCNFEYIYRFKCIIIIITARIHATTYNCNRYFLQKRKCTSTPRYYVNTCNCGDCAEDETKMKIREIMVKTRIKQET